MKNRRHHKCCGSHSISREKYFILFLLQPCCYSCTQMIAVKTLCPETSDLSVRSQEGNEYNFQECQKPTYPTVLIVVEGIQATLFRHLEMCLNIKLLHLKMSSYLFIELYQLRLNGLFIRHGEVGANAAILIQKSQHLTFIELKRAGGESNSLHVTHK